MYRSNHSEKSPNRRTALWGVASAAPLGTKKQATRPLTINSCGPYFPKIYANISGATMDASDSITNRGVAASSFPQVIFSLGTAPL